MSLINEALKRARQLQKKQKPADPANTPLQPVESNPSNKPSSGLVLAGSLAILALAGWFLWQWWSGGSQPLPTASKPPATTNPPSSIGKTLASIKSLTNQIQAVAAIQSSTEAIVQTNAVPASSEQVVASTSPAAGVTNAAAPTTETATNVLPLPRAASDATTQGLPQKVEDSVFPTPTARNVAFPPLKLQGIYFRLNKPSVLINNRTLSVGEEVEGVRVAGIERFSVRMEFKGATTNLFLK